LSTDPDKPLDLEQLKRLLTGLYPEWQAFLRRAYPGISAHHGELLQQTAEDVLTFAMSPSHPAVRDWRLLAYRILHRRIADHFRSATRRWAELPEDLPDLNPQNDPERVAHFRALLRRVVAFMAQLSDSDRELLQRSAGENDSGVPLTEAERKRLSRLRARLREHIEK